MSIKEISHASFEASPKNEKVYEITIHFLDQEGKQVSDKQFMFLQKEKMQEGSVVDIYSQNGTCVKGSLKVKLKHIFRKSDEQGIAAALNHPYTSSQTLFVLDLQDQHTGYLDCQECHRRHFQM